MNEKPNQIDESTLIDILDGVTDTPVQSNISDNDIIVFINQFGLEKGRHLVSIKLLYRLYYLWSKTPVSEPAFKLKLGSYFINDKGKLLLNLDTIKIDKYTYNYINNEMSNIRQSTQKKHLVSFIDKYNLTKGNIWLTFDVFYYLYGVWIYSLNKKNGIGKAPLRMMLQLLLPWKIKHNVLHFGVSPLIYNHITQEQIEEIKQGKRQSPQAKSKPKI